MSIDAPASLYYRAQRAVKALRTPDASMQRVPNTVRQSVADVIAELIDRAWPKPKPPRREPCGDCVDGHCTMNCGPAEPVHDQQQGEP